MLFNKHKKQVVNNLDIGYCTEIKRSKKKLEFFNEQSSHETLNESSNIKKNEQDFTTIIDNDIDLNQSVDM